jgi:hypothetical protein
MGWAGLEPAANALKGRCSTIELPTRNFLSYVCVFSMAANPESFRGCSTIELPSRKGKFVIQLKPACKKLIVRRSETAATELLADRAANSFCDPIQISTALPNWPPSNPARDRRRHAALDQPPD